MARNTARCGSVPTAMLRIARCNVHPSAILRRFLNINLIGNRGTSVLLGAARRFSFVRFATLLTMFFTFAAVPRVCAENGITSTNVVDQRELNRKVWNEYRDRLGDANKREFDKSLWDKYSYRIEMLSDVRQHLVRGMTISKVHELLGEPDPVHQNRDKNTKKGTVENYALNWSLISHSHCGGGKGPWFITVPSLDLTYHKGCLVDIRAGTCEIPEQHTLPPGVSIPDNE